MKFQLLSLLFVFVLGFDMNAKTIKKDNHSINIEKVDKRINKASYYGNTYRYINGKPRHTANGDVFDMNAMTCASMIHPFGTMLKVTNTKNGKTVIVRVTDRGRFSSNKLDLTYGAWGKIADLDKNGKPNYRAGILPIKVVILKKIS